MIFLEFLIDLLLLMWSLLLYPFVILGFGILYLYRKYKGGRT